MNESIYYNGKIITMDDKEEVEAIIVKEGRIYKTGKELDIMKYKSENTEMIDLEGKTMLPGFIDPHSHFYPTAQLVKIPELAPEPIGDIRSIDDIINKLRRTIKDNNIPEGGYIVAKGYDETLLEEGRSPNKFDLDEISNKHYIYIMHNSLHVAVANSKALEKMGISKDTPDPEGGKIGRLENSMEPNGILEEVAHRELSAEILGAAMKEDSLTDIFKSGQEIYASEGITTVQDGALAGDYYPLLEGLDQKGFFDLDIIGYYLVNNKSDVRKMIEDIDNLGSYDKRFKIGGIKILLDGSPQAKTAWLSKPYEDIDDGYEKDYKGYPTISDNEKIIEIFEEALKNDLQILGHANGDQASEQFIQCYEEAIRRTNLGKDLRPVMIHAQTVREDQLDRMKKINMIPSFFVMHTYFWGDLHLKNLGQERGSNISPIRSAVKRDMIYTTHADTPVLPSDMLFNIWTAVKRETREGKIIGSHQRISVMEAIKSITINAAYQYFEEDIKGSISEGKLADLVILDKNPLEVDIDSIKDIKVMETIKEGNRIWSTEK